LRANIFENEIYFKFHEERIDGRKFRCMYHVEHNNIPTLFRKAERGISASRKPFIKNKIKEIIASINVLYLKI